ncbi:MAG: Tad domain-containing protein [Selenomonadaceae bacterium]|nr:Tad domain-containing protein [Selenomonadaceae bacterium]
MLRKFLKISPQKGQVIVFYALVVPLLFCFVGAAADFGWLYFNQSRLQNAADAAVNAGVKELLKKDQSLSDYTYTTFVANSEEGLQGLIDSQVISSRDTTKGDKVAKNYVIKNLSKNNDLSDSWNNNADVTFKTILYGSDEDDYQALYYTVILEEKFKHLFGVLEAFGLGDLHTKAVAVAKITHNMQRLPDDGGGDSGDGNKSYPHGPSLYDQMKAIEEAETYADWDIIKEYYDNRENLASFPISVSSSRYAADARSVITAGQYYEKGNFFRTEVATLKGIGFYNPGGNYHNRGYLREEPKVNQFLLDDLFVDFRSDISDGSIKYDWDIYKRLSNGAYKWDYGDPVSSEYDKYSFRIHYMINIDKVYPVRDGREAPDPLYARIESEPMTSARKPVRSDRSSVRQIIINVNVDNTNEKTDRPIIFFYEGPEAYVSRHSEPIILNLNHDFRGVIFAPVSYVAINGNGHNFEGFVVAEKYVRLKTADDYTEVTYKNETHYVNFSDLTDTKISNDDLQVNYKGTTCYVPKKKLYSLVTQEKNVIKEPTASSKTYEVFPMIIDGCGNVQYTDEVSASEDLATGAKPNDPDSVFGDDKTFSGDPFNLASSTYNSFLQVGLVNYTYLDGGSIDNLFTTPRSKHVD